MQRGKIVIIALAGLFQGSNAAFAPDVVVPGSAVSGPGNPCPSTQISCVKCSAWVKTVIQSQMESFQTELMEVCKMVPKVADVDLATGQKMTEPQLCMNKGTQMLVTNGDEVTVQLAATCVSAVEAQTGGSNDEAAIGAAVDQWKASASPEIASRFKKEASGILDNLAREEGVVVVPTANQAMAASATDSTPPRLDLVNSAKMVADKTQESQGVTTNIILGAGAFVLFSLAVVGVKKYRSSRMTRQVHVALADEEENIE
jgi:hypothetical protein